MRRLLLLAALCMALALVFSAPVLAQSASASASAEGGAITARGADTVPLNPDGTCPEGYVTVNAPFCAEESPNTPGRIFGYGEGDLASAAASASSSASASADPCPDPDFPRETPDGCQASELPDVELGSASASATASASAADEVEDLPDTGGLSPALASVPLALLAVAGLLSLRVVRRG